MAIIKQGILGGFKGKVGSVVGTSWKGRAVMKAKPLSVANPRTSGQVAQRTAFSDCVDFAKRLVGGSILLLDNPFSGNISGYNAFMSRNTKHFPINWAAEAGNIEMSNGSLGGVTVNSISFTDGTRQNLELDFTDNGNSYSLDNDKIVVTVYDYVNDVVLLNGSDIGERQDGTIAFSLNAPLPDGANASVYVSAVREDKKYVSDSVQEYL